MTPPHAGNDPFSAFTACGVRPRDATVYKYFNAESSEGGVMSVKQATAQSVNTAYVEMEKHLDLCGIAATAQSLGVHLANPANAAVPAQKGHDLSSNNDSDGGRNTDLYVSPSLTLGVNEIAPLTMASSYATFAADGTYCEPVAIGEVLDNRGQPLEVPPASCSQVLPMDVARNVTEALQSVITDGTGSAARLDRPAAGKTGTTNDSSDAWFVGYTPQLAGAVWMGHADGTYSMTEDHINGAPRQTIYGGTIAAPTWAAIVGTASTRLNLPVTSFAAASGSPG